MYMFMLLAASACMKHVDLVRRPPLPRPRIVGRDSMIMETNRQVAAILANVYGNDSAYAEVNAAIQTGYYADERVLLRDLLMPTSSPVYVSTRFNGSGVRRGVFCRKFGEVLRQPVYAALREQIDREMTGLLSQNNTSEVASNLLLAESKPAILSGPAAVAIYFPYATDLLKAHDSNGLPRATIVAADREADEGPGRAPEPCGGGICYHDVVVNDAYAVNSPTHIVENGATPASVNALPVDEESAVSRVYIGSARLTRQMDALISFTGNGGGSEIKVARLSGYLKQEGQQVTNFSGDVVSVDFSRSDIRNQRWKHVFCLWDANWLPDNVQQVFAVYEDDTRGTKTFSGELSTTLTRDGKPSSAKVTGDIGYKVEVSTQDDIITQRTFDRLSFFRDGMNSQGWGFAVDESDFLPPGRDWPVYDGGSIWQYSMPWRMM